MGPAATSKIVKRVKPSDIFTEMWNLFGQRGELSVEVAGLGTEEGRYRALAHNVGECENVEACTTLKSDTR